MKKIVFFSAILLATIAGYAQTIMVDDISDLSPVKSAVISSVFTKTSLTTDEKGQFDIAPFPENDTLIISHISFQTLRIAVSKAKLEKSIYLVRRFIPINEFVVSANKIEERRDDIPQLIGIISRQEIQQINPMTSGDMLESSGMVFVQQSQFGGSSPILRGFEANRVLIVVDGIRMNNAIYRSGHLQNVITIDPEMLDKTEIMFGPGSVIYGSDALGGVMAFFTPSPRFSSTGKTQVSGRALLRYSTAAGEQFASAGFNVGGKKWASYTNFTYKNLGDLREGNIHDPAFGDWGKCLNYAERINGKDSMLVNDNPNIQRNSGFNQTDILQKFNVKIGSKSLLKANLQYSNSSDVPRYDRLSQMSGANLTYAEWYYGPQTRALGALTFETSAFSFADVANFTISYQNISEDRISRKFNKTTRRHQNETVDVMGFYADLMKKIKTHEFRYGLEFRNDAAKSEAYGEDINTGETAYDEVSRYPDDYNKMLNMAAYASHAWELSEKWISTQGIRFTHVSLQSAWTDTMMTLTGFPFDKAFTQTNNAISGNLGFVFKAGKGWRLAINASSGFRAPNVDDAGKVNDSNSGDNLLIIPNPLLKPEYSYTGEFTVGKLFGKNVWFENTVYYTLLDNAMVMRPTTLNGLDSVVFDGSLCAVQSNINAGSAYIYGVQSSLTAEVTSHFTIKSHLNYTYGRVDDNTPLDHIPPTFGQTSFRLQQKQFSGEFYVRYSSWKRLKDYSPSGEDNLTYATAYGMPSWTTLNVRAAYQFNKNVQLQVALENILDTHYRKFASGISSPGRNFIVALRANF